MPKSLAIGAIRHGTSLNEHRVHLLREERTEYGEHEQAQRIPGWERPPFKP